MYQAEEGNAADIRNESNMNAAGRSTVHPFRDLRSAAYARKRARNQHSSSPRIRSVGERKWWQAERRIDNKRKKRDALISGIEASQRREQIWSPGKSKNREVVVWETNLKEEFDEQINDMLDDVVRYEKLHRNSEVFQVSKSFTEAGETVSAWRWHRNASGCWQIGYRDCDGCAIPCSCCNSGNGSMFYPCHCAEFGDEPAPDEQQRCSLVEWVRDEGMKAILAEESTRDFKDSTCNEYDSTTTTEDEWDFVDDNFDVQSFSSVASSI